MDPPDIVLDSLRILLWMGLPVLAGYLLGTRVLRRRVGGEQTAAALSRVVGLFALMGAAAPLMVLVLWVVPLPTGPTVLLPLVGIAVHTTGSVAGWLIARWLREPVERHGVFLLGGGSSNVLTFGSITVVFLLRSPSDPHAETALGEMAIYRLAETPYYFLFAWPLAAFLSRPRQGVPTDWSRAFLGAIRSPTIAPILGIASGIALNLAGVERPDLLSGATDVLVRANVVLLGFTVGLTLRRAAPLRHWKPCAMISAIKFVVMPAVGLGTAWTLGFRGETLQVIAICSSMPVAFMAVVGVVMYRLDEELIGSFWLFTTLAMVVVVPTLAFFLRQLGTL